jgi:hypothetical protein
MLEGVEMDAEDKRGLEEDDGNAQKGSAGR